MEELASTEELGNNPEEKKWLTQKEGDGKAGNWGLLSLPLSEVFFWIFH